MNFTEKLKRIAADVNKTKIGPAVGLGPTTISSYIAKGSIPRADIALKIARALAVPLEWLVDDSREWPPPVSWRVAAGIPDEDFFYEWGCRMDTAARRLDDELKKAEKVDWDSYGKQVASIPLGEALPIDLERLRMLQASVQACRFALDRFGAERRILDGGELEMGKLVARHRALIARPTYRAFFDIEVLRNTREHDDGRHGEMEARRRKLLSELEAKPSSRTKGGKQ